MRKILNIRCITTKIARTMKAIILMVSHCSWLQLDALMNSENKGKT
jgi:hypothetical protein